MSNDEHATPGNGKPAPGAAPDVLTSRGRSTIHLGDLLFGGSARASSLIIVVVVLIIGTFLLSNAWQPLLDNTANFFTSTTFDASSRPPHFGIAALLWTTVLSSVIALLIAVPVAIGIALLLTQYVGGRVSRGIGPAARRALVAGPSGLVSAVRQHAGDLPRHGVHGFSGAGLDDPANHHSCHPRRVLPDP